MKTRITNLLVTLALFAGIHQAAAQGTAFTYNGQLDVNGNPANGSYDLSFTLYNASTNGTAFGSQTNSGIAVAGGLFIATLDFGSVFNGTNYWLEIAARTNGGGAFSTVSPRQPVTPAPQAIYAATAGSAVTAATAGRANSVSTTNLVGTIADSQLSSNISRLNIANTTTQATAGVVIFSGFIVDTTITNHGAGYTTAPVVTVTDVSGSNAVITATVVNGAVTSLAVEVAGAHYSAGTTLTIAPPPSNAYQTFNCGNVFNGVSTFNNAGGNFAGSFTGNGAGLTNVNLTGPSAISALGNTASGWGALNRNTTGSNNTASGSWALGANTTGFGNTANGHVALTVNTSGFWNTASGVWALNQNTTGSANTASGSGALISNNEGSYDTASGAWALVQNTTGSANTASGAGALNQNTTGNNNTANGQNALYSNTTGGNNIAEGSQAGYNITTGSSNIDIGNVGLATDNNIIRIGSGQTQTFLAGVSGASASGGAAVYVTSSGQLGTVNIAGSASTAIGSGALECNTGSFNTASGAWALNQNRSGSYNTANGGGALNQNTSGSWDTANGSGALQNNTTGSDNTANGSAALFCNTTGIRNTANGSGALFSNTNGTRNVAVGYQSLYSNTSGDYNVANGDWSMFYNTSGSSNNAYGHQALYSNTSGNYNVAVGEQALHNTTNGINNIALGYLAGYNFNGSESNNIDIGNRGVPGESFTIRIGTPGTQTNTIIAGVISGNGAGLTNLNLTGPTANSALRNAANGYHALASNTTGTNNTANGYDALQYNTGGVDNTASGFEALWNNTSGSWNTASGSEALAKNRSGAGNTANGHRALYANTGGYNNTANGSGALLNNIIGADNTANGFFALYSNTSGNNNIALGSQAGYNITTGSSNIDIGNMGLATDTNIIRIGSGQTQAFIAGQIVGDGSGLTNLNAAQLSSGTIPLSQLPGTVVTNNASGVTLSGSFTGNGTGLTNLNAASLGGLNAANFWQLGGNNVGSGQFIGSTNNQPLELRTSGGVGINTNNPQATLDVNGSLRVNSGTVFTNLQAGQAQMGGGSSTSYTNLTISFPKTFVGTPKVVATINADPASDVPETFVVSVRKVSATGCTVNIVRVDTAAGWSQALSVNWMAWE